MMIINTGKPLYTQPNPRYLNHRTFTISWKASVLWIITIMAYRYQAIKIGGPFEKVLVNPPVPKEGEVLIRLHAIGLNPIDWKQLWVNVIIHGLNYLLTVHYTKAQLELPSSPGQRLWDARVQGLWKTWDQVFRASRKVMKSFLDWILRSRNPLHSRYDICCIRIK